MVAKVRFVETWKYDKTSRMFVMYNSEILWVTSFKNGIATVEPMTGTNIYTYSKLIAGCFEEESNFESELLKSFGCDTQNTALTGIQLKFNNFTMLVTKENADADKIVEAWRDSWH